MGNLRPGALPLAITTAFLFAACASAGRGLPAPPAGLELGGSWKLNASATEEQMRAGDGESPGAGRGAVIRPGGTAGGTGPRIRGGGASGFQAVAPPATFTLTQTDSVVRFAFETKRSVSVPTNGRKVSTQMWPGIEEVELRATWTEQGLRVDRFIPGGPSVSEIYSRSPGSDRLIVTTDVSTPMGRRQLTRIYDRVE